MLATPWERPFDDPQWWFEVKWDGFRTIAYLGPTGTELRSRRGNDLGPRFPEVAAMSTDQPMVLDGEIVTLDDRGVPSFHLLGARPAHFVAFDLLYLDGDQTTRPLEERRELLASLPLPAPAVGSEMVAGDGEALFAAVVERGMEGIVAKRAGSTYQPGHRSPDWRKIAHRRRSRAVVGGFLSGEGNRVATFGSLLVGLWAPDGLRFVGAVGSGFNDRDLKALSDRLGGLARDTSPFVNPIDVPGRKHYVDPVLVVEIEYREWTPYQRLRAPVFKGMSEITAKEASWEAEGPDR
jgi:bifunctional non-homologous end joining protein LigD